MDRSYSIWIWIHLLAEKCCSRSYLSSFNPSWLWQMEPKSHTGRCCKFCLNSAFGWPRNERRSCSYVPETSIATRRLRVQRLLIYSSPVAPICANEEDTPFNSSSHVLKFLDDPKKAETMCKLISWSECFATQNFVKKTTYAILC
jgi:hypothetical protein